MPVTARLDAELVRRGLARSRGQAHEMLAAHRVLVDGAEAQKASRQVDEASDIVVTSGEQPDYVGRGALKLAGLLDDLAAAGQPVVVEHRRCLDAGASTGGFTEVLLQRGAAEVVAVDVGHDQLAAPLRAHEQVRDLSGTSVRGLTAEQVGGPVAVLVADLSFISLQVVLPDLRGLAAPGADLLLLVKPQFEVGRERLGRGGVVRDARLRQDAVLAVARAGRDLGMAPLAVVASRWPGPSGNVEYFVRLRTPGSRTPAAERPDTTPAPPGLTDDEQLADAVRRAVEEGPS